MASESRTGPNDKVRRYVKERSPRLKSDEVQDVAGEAIKRALELNPKLTGDGLTAGAQGQVEAVLRQRRDNARRGHRVSDASFTKGAPDQLEPHRRNRAPQI